MDAGASHWQRVYRARPATELSWYEAEPAVSLSLIEEAALPREAPLLDVGGGASTLVDHLLARGYTDVSVLDLVPEALEVARRRLGEDAERVRWLVADVTAFRPERTYSLWHDRAVLHFLVDESERDAYRAALAAGLAAGGHLVLGAFGPEGPERCSGLPVRRYAAAELDAWLGKEFRQERHVLMDHRTPDGTTQQFLYGRWRRAA